MTCSKSVSSHFRSINPRSYKNFFFVRCIKIINISLNELKLFSKNRGIKDYKNKSKDELTKILSEPEPKINIEKIRKTI